MAVGVVAGRIKGAEASDGGYLRGDASAIVCEERTFVQTSGNGTYTATVALPAGATILDIKVKAGAVWDGTSASLEVGDNDDPDGFWTAVNLVATDLLLNEELSFSDLGATEAGAYIAAQVKNTYRAVAKTITITIVQVGTGTLGRTRVLVSYIVPTI